MLFTFLTLLTSVMALPQPLPIPIDAIPTFTAANFGTRLVSYLFLPSER
jgi:hypothetical protein